MSEDNQAWHMDKRVPIGIIAALVVQTVALLYTEAAWRAETGSRINALEIAVDDNVALRRKQWDRIELIEQQQKLLDSQLSGLDERTRGIARQTDRIVDILLKQTPHSNSGDNRN
ncbi:hypothetical protein L2D14_01455 [Thalassospiraceae bacterium LMO-JJ14]|nr:hypothetical protein L2D14_01455 [Thalassospiraceae bacterium LMO-JJ14]